MYCNVNKPYMALYRVITLLRYNPPKQYMIFIFCITCITLYDVNISLIIKCIIYNVIKCIIYNV